LKRVERRGGLPNKHPSKSVGEVKSFDVVDPKHLAILVGVQARVVEKLGILLGAAKAVSRRHGTRKRYDKLL
jgi:hypothetical protein